MPAVAGDGVLRVHAGAVPASDSFELFVRAAREFVHSVVFAQKRFYGIEVYGKGGKVKTYCSLPDAKPPLRITFGIYASEPEVPPRPRPASRETKHRSIPRPAETPPLPTTQAAKHFNFGTSVVINAAGVRNLGPGFATATARPRFLVTETTPRAQIGLITGKRRWLNPPGDPGAGPASAPFPKILERERRWRA